MYSGTVKVSDLNKGAKPNSGHRGQSGLQNHSIGDIYPWTIVIRGHGPGVCYAQHCITDEKLLEFRFTKMGEGGDFKKAHRLAEQTAIHKGIN